ncbi:amidohydrolase family protein [Nonomuraea sp. NPDC049480]|uniref:amidohydrolase family protein n=1 Tax=Nonomuraea sp. NPDC049480 TaxID=3364353 RepID=UPI00378CF908
MTPNTCVFNSRALELLDITAETPDRVGNVWIEKDAGGTPTGRMHGSVTNYYNGDPFMEGLLRRIPLISMDTILPAARLIKAAEMTDLSDDMLRVDGLSIARGGPCAPGLLLMRQPYTGPYGEPTTGRSFVRPEGVEQAMRHCLERGLRLSIMAAGTGEQDIYLDQLEGLGRPPRTADGRPWLMEHLALVEEDQIRRFAALGVDVTTTMSFSWGKGELIRGRLGEQYLQHLVPLRRLLDGGLRVAAGTYWGPKNVFEQIALAVEPTYAASGRRAVTPGISRTEALGMWTRQAAQVLGWKGIGSLVSGNHADLVVIDRDPLTAPLEEVPATAVISTVVAGVTVSGTPLEDL